MIPEDDGYKRFDYPPCAALDDFDEAFDAGGAARDAGLDYRACPAGIPLPDRWTQDDVLRIGDAQMAGWLFGWWARGFIADPGEWKTEAERKASFHGAGHMAALLWVGAQDWSDEEREEQEAAALLHGGPVTDEDLACLLGCSVAAARKLAGRERWPYRVTPEEGRPSLMVYPGGKED